MKLCSRIKNVSPKTLKRLILLSIHLAGCGQVAEQRKNRRIRLIWAVLLGIGFPVAIVYPFYDTYVVKHLAANLQVSFDFTNGLLFIASILFGFSSLMVVSKEWVDRRIWTALLPPWP